jgi:5-methylcytosine-specific restriction endonuclease McrA
VNNWNIPASLELEIRSRDKRCVYCNVQFESDGTRKTSATWEHIVNDARIIKRENIALCCFSCNSSKGAKELTDWLESDYCKRQRVTPERVSEVVREALINTPTF